MLTSLKLRPSETALLVGAGVSVDAPSCIPAAHAVVAALSDWLGNGDAEQADRARQAMTARGNNPYALVRFEQVWQTLDNIMPGISRTLESLELFGSPNENHHALAEILTHGGSVITTNFDRRIEWALRRRGTRCNPWVFGRSKSTHDADTQYFKVHGSFGRRRQLLATLFSIGSAGLAFSRMPQLKDALSAQVDGRTLVVAGYSFSDHFDLVPLIENEWRPSRIVWIDYQPGATGAVSTLEAIEETIMPDAALPFPVGALARVRARLPGIEVMLVRHVAVWKVLDTLGLATPAASEAATEDTAALNRASFEEALDDAAWTQAQKHFAIQMLEKQDGFGFHTSLDTAHDNDWAVLETEDEPEQKQPDPGETVYEAIAGLIREKHIHEAASLLKTEARRPDLKDSRALLLAEALCAREQGHLRQAWRLQLRYVDERNATELSFWSGHRHELETAELYASVALDYLTHARLLNDEDFAAELIAGLRNLFDQSGLIWVAVEAGLADSRMARRGAPQRLAPADFNQGAALAEQAAYYAWRSGRWDLAKRAVNEFTWYLTMAGKADAAMTLLERLRAVCPEIDHPGWVALTANLALTAALYVDPRRARLEISAMEQRISKDDRDLWLHVLVCLAACDLAEGERVAGLASLRHAQQELDALGTDVWGHQSCIDAIRQRFQI